MTPDLSLLRLCWPLLGIALLISCGKESVIHIRGLSTNRIVSEESIREPTRAELNEDPYATIAIESEISSRKFYLRAITDNEGYITYFTRAGISLTLYGSAISGHRGFGYDMVGFNSSPDDPLVMQTPLLDWPKSVDRAYQMRRGDGSIYTRSVVCTPIRGEEVKIEIAEIVFDVVEIKDRCRSGNLAFSNHYWVAAKTGFIWKSVQWTGPRMHPLTVEIIRPYSRL